jgi:hypothetical protein
MQIRKKPLVGCIYVRKNDSKMTTCSISYVHLATNIGDFSFFFLFFLLSFFFSEGIKLRASWMLSKGSTTELHLQPGRDFSKVSHKVLSHIISHSRHFSYGSFLKIHSPFIGSQDNTTVL